MSVFTKQLPLKAFLQENNCTTINLVRNPNTDKVFFDAGNGIQGRVSNKITKLSLEQYVSWFTPDDGGEPSWMLHTQDRSNQLDSLTI